jgi:hypothetical protein
LLGSAEGGVVSFFWFSGVAGGCADFWLRSREGRTVPLFVPLRPPGAKGRARRPCLAFRGTVRPSPDFGVLGVCVAALGAGDPLVLLSEMFWSFLLFCLKNLP